ncbi:Endonuclease/Exonuclease/phosphatase family protein [Thermosporothrix hazakensis]|jgi:hypothetical protein|uniref:Endonuclease/Exonuclease/phosphatase family protein n=1 Tax=Thermosporothrix hazakensis TaxID=644383 RepID=A0A326UAT3_THEHA|nr:endonuclease/exonuclease/phosphatase family protein [Thermosporothrix hazakensis]PZW34311.1 Endonuclease/Exonuclease/phosphatase family protein [Thermosporothrix hazakensis]GCE46137.1 hypothetical protein KTH_10060 [Thermosporothrix hazakensis]
MLLVQLVPYRKEEEDYESAGICRHAPHPDTEPPDGAWMDRRSVLRKGFHILQPDLLALQEVIKTAEYDQAADLLEPEWQIVHQQNRNMQGTGISIASCWPLRNIQELDLHVTPRTGDFPCGTPIAEIMAPEPIGPILFVNHFPNWQLQFEPERELQAVVVARVIEESVQRQSVYVVLAGDLDTDPAAAASASGAAITH